MFGFGMPQLIVLLVIVILVFGASRLPGLGSALGKSIKNFKNATASENDPERSTKNS